MEEATRRIVQAAGGGGLCETGSTIAQVAVQIAVPVCYPAKGRGFGNA